MKEEKYPTMRTFVAIIGIILTVLLAVSTATIAGVNEAKQKAEMAMDTANQAQNDISSIKTDLGWIKEGIIEIKNKL